MKRRGFTLVELLVVVVVIAILLTLTLKVFGIALASAKESATKTTIRKVEKMLTDRAEALDRLQRRAGYLITSPEYRAASFVTTDPNNQKILARKLLYRRYFPQSKQEWQEALSIIGPAAPSMPANIAAASNPTSSAIVYAFLQQTVGNESVGTDQFNTSEVADVDNDGCPEFIDAWGEPLYFYRWPTRLFRPSNYPGATDPLERYKVLLAAYPPNLQRDPDDPLNKLGTAYAATFETIGIPADPLIGRAAIAGPVFHSAGTFHLPLVVSSGPDKSLGLFKPDDVANRGTLAAVRDVDALYDDVTQINFRAGGR